MISCFWSMMEYVGICVFDAMAHVCYLVSHLFYEKKPLGMGQALYTLHFLSFGNKGTRTFYSNVLEIIKPSIPSPLLSEIKPENDDLLIIEKEGCEFIYTKWQTENTDFIESPRPSKVFFWRIKYQYNDPLEKGLVGIELKVKQKVFMVGNELFSKTHIEHLMKSQGLSDTFNEHYILVLNEYGKTTHLSPHQYVVLNETGFEIRGEF